MAKHKLESDELDNMLRALLVARRELVGRGQPVTWGALARVARQYSAAFGVRDERFDALGAKSLRDLFDDSSPPKMTPAEPTQEQVEAAWQALIEADWESPYMARIRNFTREEVLAGK